VNAPVRLAAWIGPQLGLATLCALVACGENSTTPQAEAVSRSPQSTYEREVAALDSAIEAALASGRAAADRPAGMLGAVPLYVERAQLTGKLDDYGNARALLDATAARMDSWSYPCLEYARLDFALNRLADAAGELDSCPGSVAREEIAGLHADIAFHSGRYRQAESIYRALVNQVGTPQQYLRLATYRSRTGAPAEAAALLEAAETRYASSSPTTKAWLKLQRGLLALDRGRFDEALAMYRAAADTLPGWWLVDEHLAEVMWLSGDALGAKTVYESVIARTGLPEHMDALAFIKTTEGRLDEALPLRRQARALHEARLRQFPETASGHAIDHLLQNQNDADLATALALAEANFAARPYGDSAVALARALLRNREPKRAETLLVAQIMSGWDTAELYWVLSEARKQLGRDADARRSEEAALERNPASAAMYATVLN
jgi:predicted Zn-dependent protease